MIKVSSERASDASGQLNARGRFCRLLSDRHVRVAAAILMLAGGLSIASRSYAQEAASPADCVDKCKYEAKVCLHNGSSEELCDYDSKACQKACDGSK